MGRMQNLTPLLVMDAARCSPYEYLTYMLWPHLSLVQQDIWSLGITFCEMATAKKPFKNAAAAVFCVCVSKQYPSLPPEVSDEAVSFLAR